MRNPRTFAELDAEEQQIVDAALQASANAYAPYSGFAVGAAVRVRTVDGKRKLIKGANFENAAYGVGICAEVAALCSANAQGQFEIDAIAVVGHKFTSPTDSSQIVRPCGRCRQLISEAETLSGARIPITVYSCNGDLSRIVDEPISELLPDAFGPRNLGLDKSWPASRKELVAAVKDLLQRKLRDFAAHRGASRKRA